MGFMINIKELTLLYRLRTSIGTTELKSQNGKKGKKRDVGNP